MEVQYSLLLLDMVSPISEKFKDLDEGVCMKNTNRLILIVLVAIIGISGVLSAQEADETPLIMLMYNELWSWSGNTEHFPVQFTACQPPDEIRPNAVATHCPKGCPRRPQRQ